MNALGATVQADRTTSADRTAYAAVLMTGGAVGARGEGVGSTSGAVGRRDGGVGTERRATEVLAQRQVVERRTGALVQVATMTSHKHNAHNLLSNETIAGWMVGECYRSYLGRSRVWTGLTGANLSKNRCWMRSRSCRTHVCFTSNDEP